MKGKLPNSLGPMALDKGAILALLGAVFFLLSFNSLLAHAEVSGEQGRVPSISLPDKAAANNQIISVRKLTSSIANIDPVVADLLKRFHQQPGDLRLIDDINQNATVVLTHVQQRITNETQRISIDEAKQLLLILSVMKHEMANDQFIALADYYSDNTTFIQQALLIMRDMPVTEAALASVNNIIKTNRDNVPVVRSALLYYLSVQHKSGMRWAAYYRSPGIDPQLRFAGMSLAATLSEDDQVTRWILDKLKSEPAIPVFQQYYLLQALHASVSEREFEHLISQLNISQVVIKEFQRLLDFNKSTGEQKRKLANFMLASPYMDQQNLALKYFILERQILDVWGNLGVSKRLSAVRIANALNIPIDSRNEAVKAEIEMPLPKSLTQSTFAYLVTITFVLFLLWLGYKYLVRNIGKFKAT